MEGLFMMIELHMNEFIGPILYYFQSFFVLFSTLDLLYLNFRLTCQSADIFNSRGDITYFCSKVTISSRSNRSP